MKKLFGLLLAVLVLYVIYFDLTVGTIPSSTLGKVDANISKTASKTASEPKSALPSFNAKVKPGATVISIVEQQLDKPLPVPISQLIDDFKALNPGESPENIQIGSTYHFPDYSK